LSEHLPSQDFNSRQYVRPNDNWTCGFAAEGKPCRLGPDGSGNCRAASECAPVLEKKEGEAKGRWKCTRSGGPCPEGPLPDGRCGKPPLRCSPRPTLRWWRGRVTMAVVAATVATLLIFAGGFWRGAFFNRGPISYAHAGPAFEERYAGTNHVHETCGACHTGAASGLSLLVASAWKADPGLLEVHKLVRKTGGSKTSATAIDLACRKCHKDHSLHRDGIPVAMGCSSCHQEHRGPGRMALPGDDSCAACHGDQDTFIETRDKIAFAGFIRGPTDRGVARNFEGLHPTFRIHDLRLKDTNTLRFNHTLHLTSRSVTSLSGGRAMDCAQCHRADASGEYVRGVSFESDCSRCHSLQFDVETPELRLPHGDPEFVSAFLRSLPKQYAEIAAKSGIANGAEQNRVARDKVRRLLEQVGSGEELEKRIFFSNSTLGPQRRVGAVDGGAPAVYAGCAYCHEVKASAQGKAEITRPFITERWLQHGDFNHRKHATMNCADCHNAAQSSDTADIIVPPKNSCASCHSPAGGVAHSCATCHNFHTKGIGGLAKNPAAREN
jgi:predicted CXXCH cytochrome family protein